MSHYNVKPIRLDFKPSRWLAWLLTCAALVACGIVLCLLTQGSVGQAFYQAPGHPLSRFFIPAVKLGLMALVLLVLRHHVLTALQRRPQACKSLRLDSKGNWQLERMDGRVHTIDVLPTSFVSSYMVVLNMRVVGQRRPTHIVILPDAVDADALRRLRVWLRWGHQHRPADQASSVEAESS